MEILIALLRTVGWMVVGSAAVELLGALLSARVRRYVAQQGF